MGKFPDSETERLYLLSLEGGHDAEAGDVEGIGWYGLFREELTILGADNYGFVTRATFESMDDLMEAWNEIEAAELELNDDDDLSLILGA